MLMQGKQPDSGLVKVLVYIFPILSVRVVQGDMHNVLASRQRFCLQGGTTTE